MRKVIAVFLALVMFICCSFVSVSATEYGTNTITPRLMPLNFYYTKTIQIATGATLPPGYADFDVVISGVYDAQADKIVSIDVKQCTYRGGVNCEVHDMTVSAQIASGDQAYVVWHLTGTLEFSWTSPITGLQYDEVVTRSSSYTFDANDYLV